MIFPNWGNLCCSMKNLYEKGRGRMSRQGRLTQFSTRCEIASYVEYDIFVCCIFQLCTEAEIILIMISQFVALQGVCDL